MKFRCYPFSVNLLLLLAGLLACAPGMAEDAASSTNAQQNAEKSTILPASSAGNNDSTAARKGLKNPNSLLVAMAFNFRNSEAAPTDYKEVIARYCRAAKHGNADAQYALGWMYANGRGVPRDASIAALLYGRAAEQGHTRALEALASTAAVSSESELPKCLLPDPPAPTINVQADKPEPEVTAVSEETIALFQSKKQIYQLVEKLAARYQIDTHLAMAFIAVESGFDPKATSPKNAQGLMQLIPETAKRFRVKNPYNPEDNIKGGLAYLQWLLAYFQGDVRLVAAAYNAGEGAVEKYKGVPPYAETQNYVQKIARLYRNPSHPYREDLVKPSITLASARPPVQTVRY